MTSFQNDSLEIATRYPIAVSHLPLRCAVHEIGSVFILAPPPPCNSCSAQTHCSARYGDTLVGREWVSRLNGSSASCLPISESNRPYKYLVNPPAEPVSALVAGSGHGRRFPSSSDRHTADRSCPSPGTAPTRRPARPVPPLVASSSSSGGVNGSCSLIGCRRVT